jgi:DNA (cytosine-5)-methyltransferase 1
MSKTRPDRDGLGRIDQLARAVYHNDSPPDPANHSSTGKNPEQWATPEAQNQTGCQTNKNGQVFPRLGSQVQNWPTPILGDSHLTSTPEAAASRLAEDKKTLSRMNPGKLNPNWVEQLMGVPVGWTQLPIEWTDFDSSETALSRLQQQKHGSN